MSYADFFKSLIRQCAEYAVANGIETNHFIETVAKNISNFSDNWVVSENPMVEQGNVKHFVVGSKFTYSEDDPIPLYELLK